MRPLSIGKRDSRGTPVVGMSAVPIVLGREPSRESSPAIVTGYDASPLAQAAVVEAGLRAGQAGCVFVVYVFRTPPGFLGRPNFDRRLSQARATGRRALGELLSGRTGLPEAEYIPELIAGSPAEAIARVAAVRNADAIVVGASRARRLRPLRATVSDELQRTIDVPVITIR